MESQDLHFEDADRAFARDQFVRLILLIMAVGAATAGALTGAWQSLIVSAPLVAIGVVGGLLIMFSTRDSHKLPNHVARIVAGFARQGRFHCYADLILMDGSRINRVTVLYGRYVSVLGRPRVPRFDARRVVAAEPTRSLRSH